MAHAHLGEVEGPGRPLEIGRPVAHAYLLRIVAEFQGFARDLHDLAVETMVSGSGAQLAHHALLQTAATSGRAIDRGNAGLRELSSDFLRIGLSSLGNRLQARDIRWATDRTRYEQLIQMRNALAHGNQQQVLLLRSDGVRDTVAWARGSLPALDRLARALDHVVWDDMRARFGADPW